MSTIMKRFTSKLFCNLDETRFEAAESLRLDRFLVLIFIFIFIISAIFQNDSMAFQKSPKDPPSQLRPQMSPLRTQISPLRAHLSPLRAQLDPLRTQISRVESIMRL